MEYTDQLNRLVNLKEKPGKIVSLVPSQTELLFHLGLENEVQGITKFCVYPKNWKKSKEIIGGTKNVNIEKIRSLTPDLIIANKEENDREQIKTLAKEFPVWISDVHNLNDAMAMIEGIGTITGRKQTASEICQSIDESFRMLDKKLHGKSQSVIYLIWREPYLTVGRDTFIHSMLCKCGFTNLFVEELRYPELTIKKLQSLNPDIIFLSSEPYPFTQKHIPEIATLCPNADIHVVDGEMFSWYGSHLIKAPDYFQTLIQEVNSAS